MQPDVIFHACLITAVHETTSFSTHFQDHKWHNMSRDPSCDIIWHHMQTHPNVDKALWNSEGLLGLKQPGKSFPLQQEVGVLKWRMQTSDESLMPLTGERGREGGRGGKRWGEHGSEGRREGEREGEGEGEGRG